MSESNPRLKLKLRARPAAAAASSSRVVVISDSESDSYAAPPAVADKNYSSSSSADERAKGPAKKKSKHSQPIAQVSDSFRQRDIFGEFDFSALTLKPDHASRPIWINPTSGQITLEAFSPLSGMAQDFLVAISEPISRPAAMHEYQMTPYSLYAAVSVGLDTESIIATLNKLSKVPVPSKIEEYIRECTERHGKVKIVLKQARFYVECRLAETLQMLLKDDIIKSARVETEDEILPNSVEGAENGQFNSAQKEKDQGEEYFNADVAQFAADEDTEPQNETALSFEIKASMTEIVKKRCVDLEYPMLEEYDFKGDQSIANLDIYLKPSTQIRPYQSKSLSKMFSNSRARSGIIVLPCGSGKTLVGITAAATIRKSCLVICTSNVSVMQWRQEFLRWSNISDSQISVFTSDSKTRFAGDAGVVVSTYSMIANTAKRSHDSAKMMEFLESVEWGFLLLDEVHVVPAAMFRRVLGTIKAHTKLGLTATLVREDDKIDDLNFLVGPKLYEANWMELAAAGHIANVQCAEVWCPMDPDFYHEYLLEKSRKRMLLYCMNPQKFQACQYLIEYHEARGDKTIVFSDNVYSLEAYARKLNKLFIHGGTPQIERMHILQHFQTNPAVNTIFLSKVGDTSIDLPEATCLIQISSHFGSRRQEAQRLGRILRAKRRNDEGFNAFFYSLVSKDTMEMYYSAKRQGFLIDQGYAFKVITKLEGMTELPNLVYRTRDEKIELLQNVLLANETQAEIGNDIQAHEGDLPGTVTSKDFGVPRPDVKRIVGSLTSLAGAQHMSYIERNKGPGKALNKEAQQNRNKLFKKRDAQREAQRKAAQRKAG